jgi:hypothetical protein
MNPHPRAQRIPVSTIKSTAKSFETIFRLHERVLGKPG